jgi:hypothetical protein
MKRILTAAITGSLLLALSSCQKETDGSFINQNDSTAIQQVIVLDTTFAPGVDTILKLQLSYDVSKKLNKTIFWNYDFGSSGSITSRDEYNYKFTGTNPHPDNIIHNYFDLQTPSGNYTDTTSFSYSNGFVLKDSNFNSTGYITTEFTKLSNTRYKMLQRSPDVIPPGLFIDTTYSFVNWQNGNLLTEIDSLWIPSFSFWDITNAILLYDNRPNPFKDLVIPYPTPANSDIYGFGLESLFLPTANNIISWNDGTSPTILNYEYGANLMPKIGRTNDGVKIIYKYTRL